MYVEAWFPASYEVVFFITLQLILITNRFYVEIKFLNLNIKLVNLLKQAC